MAHAVGITKLVMLRALTTLWLHEPGRASHNSHGHFPHNFHDYNNHNLYVRLEETFIGHTLTTPQIRWNYCYCLLL